MYVNPVSDSPEVILISWEGSCYPLEHLDSILILRSRKKVRTYMVLNKASHLIPHRVLGQLRKTTTAVVSHFLHDCYEPPIGSRECTYAHSPHCFPSHQLIPLHMDHLASNAMRTFAEKPPETVAFVNPHAIPTLTDFVATSSETKKVEVFRYSDWIRSPERPMIIGIVVNTITYQAF